MTTKAEKLYMNRVAELGCIICRMPTELHHPRFLVGGAQKASNYDVIPLCFLHHRGGGYGVAFHQGKKAFEANFGTEAELLEKTRELINVG